MQLIKKVQCFTAKFELLHQAFRTSEVSIDKLLRPVGTINNANQLESFVATLGGINAGHRANASIRVRPNTMCRRAEGVTRGSKCLACGRPALGTKRANSDQEIWQIRLAIINLMRNNMVLVIKDKITCLCDFSFHDVAFLIEKMWPGRFLSLIN
jgi:hypothetical protein